MSIKKRKKILMIGGSGTAVWVSAANLLIGSAKK